MVALDVTRVTDDDFERHVLAAIRAAREKCAVGDAEGADGHTRKIVKQCRECLQIALDAAEAGLESAAPTEAPPPAETEDGAAEDANSGAHEQQQQRVRRRKRLLATALNCHAFVLKSGGKIPKAVRCAREAYDLESEINDKLTTTALNLCVLYTAVGKYDAAVAMGDEAVCIVSLLPDPGAPSVVLAALHYNRGNALLHRLTEFGVGKAADAFSALQLAKSFARDAMGKAGEGERLFALSEKAATALLEQFGPQVTRETHCAADNTRQIVAKSALPSAPDTKPAAAAVAEKHRKSSRPPKGGLFSTNPFKLPSVYRQKAPRPPPPGATASRGPAATSRRPAAQHATATADSTPSSAKPTTTVFTQPLPPINGASASAKPRAPPEPPRTPVAQPAAAAAAPSPGSHRTNSRRARRAADARSRAAHELARQPMYASDNSRPATTSLADRQAPPLASDDRQRSDDTVVTSAPTREAHPLPTKEQPTAAPRTTAATRAPVTSSADEHRETTTPIAPPTPPIATSSSPTPPSPRSPAAASRSPTPPTSPTEDAPQVEAPVVATAQHVEQRAATPPAAQSPPPARQSPPVRSPTPPSPTPPRSASMLSSSSAAETASPSVVAAKAVSSTAATERTPHRAHDSEGDDYGDDEDFDLDL